MEMKVNVRKNEIWLVNLDPTIGSEIRKSRPCVVVSPDAMNKYLATVIVAPLTSTHKNYPSRVDSIFQGTPGQIALDQLRGVDKVRLTKKLGLLDKQATEDIRAVLATMFSS
jgi:mRNA interferase MazF